MPRRIVDHGPGAGAGRARPRRPRRAALLAGAGIALLLVAGLLGTVGRQVYHQLRSRGTATSHALSAAQLAALEAISPQPYDPPEMRRAPAATPDPTPSPMPDSAILPVPYTVQAPFNNWKVHEQSCEEAALLMYHDFLEGDRRPDIPPQEADGGLRAMKAWQVSNWGAERDLTLDRIGQLAQQYYGYDYQVSDATQANIEAALAAGHPVVVPVMTHSLLNPNYGPNTVYHVVLIKGFEPGGVVTNDAGVMQGKNWFYSWSVLFSAIDAQTPRMGQGRMMLVVYKR
jgi:hypothetical protein